MKKILSFFLFLVPFCTLAQSLPSIEEKTKGLKKMDGFLPYYVDVQNGKLWLEVDKIDMELLYVISLPAGLGSNDIGLDRGLLGGGRIVKFSKVGKKVLLVEPNYAYRAVSPSERERIAVEQSFAAWCELVLDLFDHLRVQGVGIHVHQSYVVKSFLL